MKTKVTLILVKDVKSGKFSIHQLIKKHKVSKSLIYNISQRYDVPLFNNQDCRRHIGKRMGKLIVLDVIQKNSVRDNRKITMQFICKCDCGNIVKVRRICLIGKHTRSCGCLRKENAGHCLLPNNQSMLNSLYTTYVRNAFNRDLKFKISKKEFYKITQKDCYYCGTKPFKKHWHPKSPSVYIYNGIDRIDNNKGYIMGNIAPCCENCNRAKYKLSKNEFLDLVKNIYIKHYKK